MYNIISIKNHFYIILVTVQLFAGVLFEMLAFMKYCAIQFKIVV